MAIGIKSATVNRKLSYLGHFFKWCEGRDYLKTNPTKGLRVTGRAQAEDKMIRIGFTLTQMHLIREALEAKRKTQPEWYRVSLVAMHTGMRAGEVWTLHCDRLQSERGIDYIELQADKPRKVLPKNKNATRKVRPSQCAQGGLPGVCRGPPQEAGDTSRLFPAIGSTSPVSRFFGRVCEGIKIKQKDLSLHSCRHFQASEMVKQGVQFEIRHYHLVHGLAPSVQNAVLVHLDFPLEPLQEAVEKVTFQARPSDEP